MEIFDLDDILGDTLKSYKPVYSKVIDNDNVRHILEYLCDSYKSLRNSTYSSFIFAMIGLLILLTLCFCVFLVGFIFGSVSIFCIVNVLPSLTMTF